MKTIQVVRLLDAVPVTSIARAVGVTPPSLIITGDDFRNVEGVILNGFDCPEFAVLSQKRLIAEVPQALYLASITDVLVLSYNLTLTEQSLVEFSVGRRVRSAQGVLRLMQVFLRQLLRTPGSNVFHKRSGGGLLRKVGTLLTRESAADIQIAIDRTRQYVMSVQAASPEIPPSERLLSAEVAGIRTDPESTSASVTIILTSHTGARSAATLNS